MVALRAYLRLLIEASLRVLKGFQLRLVDSGTEFVFLQLFLGLLEGNVCAHPLVLALLAVNGDFGTPALQHQRPEVVVVEEALVLDVTPVAVVAGELFVGATDRMRSTNGCYQGPCILSTSIDVVNEDLFETIFAISAVAPVLRIRHPALIPLAVFHGVAPPLEAIAERLVQSLAFFGVPMGPGHGRLRDNYKEVGQRNVAPVIIEEVRDSMPGQTLLQADVIGVLEVDAPIGATFVLVVGTVVHEVVASRTEQASHETSTGITVGSELGREGIELVENCLGNLFVVGDSDVFGVLQTVGEHLLEVLYFFDLDLGELC